VSQDSDRRLYRRTRIAATAVLACAPSRYLGTYLVENLSAGGVLLVGRPAIDEQTRLRVMLCLSGSRKVTVAARLRRRDQRGTNDLFALRFEEISAETVALLEAVVAQQLLLDERLGVGRRAAG
jgi:hypothetical protein